MMWSHRASIYSFISGLDKNPAFTDLTRINATTLYCFSSGYWLLLLSLLAKYNRRSILCSPFGVTVCVDRYTVTGLQWDSSSAVFSKRQPRHSEVQRLYHITTFYIVCIAAEYCSYAGLTVHFVNITTSLRSQYRFRSDFKTDIYKFKEAYKRANALIMRLTHIELL